ncbi:PREDICTED: uncharacterized protein LOC109241630 [Nicotiana attenuata]|uniref:uncharacterized protein LOC109241630 n=1 Tax=Nicotiana attenuata TaxID=49451 RepID=UPI000905732D|nr:PREDICTED: uncharacterized protein LOC109241630 [Nicotiana attenuata]
MTDDGSGDPNLQIKLTLTILTFQDPSKLGYLKISNFVLQEHLKKNRKGKWYLDSACSRHMTGDKQLFKTVIKLDGGTITFGDKSKENVIGVGKVPLSSTCDVDEVYQVDELGYNLLSISQLYEKDYEVRFKKHGWFIEDESGKVILSGISHNFSSPRSPQQNGVVERKNRTLQDMERTMIVENSLPHCFWAEAERIIKVNQQTQPADVPVEIHESSQTDQSTNVERDVPSNTPNDSKSEPGYPHKFIIGDPYEGITTRRSQKNKYHVALISQLEPKKVDKALKDTH